MNKTRNQNARYLSQIERFKWQFLRRNKRYIKDCEKWSGRPKAKWSDREIILGYPCTSKAADLSVSRREQFKNGAEAYRKQHWDEWQTFNDFLPLIKDLKKRGLRPIESRRQGTWRQYSQKWLISLPLNPKVETRPHYVDIVPKETISEIVAMSCERNVFRNDVFLEKGTTSFIKVNWAASPMLLADKFSRMIDDKRMFLEAQGKAPSDVRAHLALYEKYLVIWDLREVERKPYKEIAKIVYPDSEKTPAQIRDRFLAAEKLINGGYKDLG